jgi:methanogenic corrinoid protein MtbC1/DNA-binding XRE family transcriptional regulator
VAADREVTGLRRRYEGAVLRGDDTAAGRVVAEGLARGVSTTSIYLDVVMAAQARVGDLWRRGRLSVAQEHLATRIGHAQLDRLRQGMRRRNPSGRRAVVAAVEGEHHELGTRVVADFLHMDGWEVDFLGADVPTADLVEFVRQRQPALVVLSATLEERLAALGGAVAALRALPHPPRILAGGAAVSSERQARRLGADGDGRDAMAALQEARRLVAAEEPPRSLPEYLRALGERVQGLRKGRRWSQHELAEAAGLDRTYISAVEHGKQNLTLGAVMKLADALEIPADQLLTGAAGQGGDEAT